MDKAVLNQRLQFKITRQNHYINMLQWKFQDYFE